MIISNQASYAAFIDYALSAALYNDLRQEIYVSFNQSQSDYSHSITVNWKILFNYNYLRSLLITAFLILFTLSRSILIIRKLFTICSSPSLMPARLTIFHSVFQRSTILQQLVSVIYELSCYIGCDPYSTFIRFILCTVQAHIAFHSLMPDFITDIRPSYKALHSEDYLHFNYLFHFHVYYFAPSALPGPGFPLFRSSVILIINFDN